MIDAIIPTPSFFITSLTFAIYDLAEVGGEALPSVNTCIKTFFNLF